MAQGHHVGNLVRPGSEALRWLSAADPTSIRELRLRSLAEEMQGVLTES
jgi:hypothetical protein